jgi:hypothetical protein
LKRQYNLTCGDGRRSQARDRIIKSSSRPRDNITIAEREAVRTLKNNTDLIILLADKGNATIIPNTVDYKQKITSLLEDPSYRRLTRDPTDSTERKTTLLLKKSTLTENIFKQLRPAGSTHPRRYIKFRRWGITQQNAYNIQNTAKV